MCVHWHLSLNSGCKVACSQALSTSAYANMEGEGLGDLVACDDVRRQTIDPNCRAELYYARVFVKLDGSNKQVDSDHMHGITTDR